jgi:uncharacterized protein (DUF305 family)
MPTQNSIRVRVRAALVTCTVVALAACSNGQVGQRSSTGAQAAASPAPAATPTLAPPTDESFVRSAAQVVAGRYALGAIGQKRGQSNAVRALAGRIASNAAESSRWLSAYAAKKHITISNRPKIRASYQYSQLTGRSGAAFDRSFLQAIHIDTSIAVDTFKQEGKTAKDPALRTFAQRQTNEFQAQLKQSAAHSV